MDISAIIKRSWDIALNHKSLWLFGLFVQGVGQFNSVWSRPSHGNGENFALNGGLWLLAGVGLVIGIGFAIMHFISSAALIDAVNKLSRGGSYTLGSSFSVGVDFFWRFVGLTILLIAAMIAVVLVLALPAVVCFLLNTVLGILSLVILIPAFLVGAYVLTNIFMLAQRAMVARNSSIGDALDEGYYLFRHNLGKCVTIFIVNLLLLIGAWIVAAVIIGIIALPFVPMALHGGAGLVMALVLGIPLILVFMLVFDGLFGTFSNAMYTLFYFALLEPMGSIAPGGYAGQPAT